MKTREEIFDEIMCDPIMESLSGSFSHDDRKKIDNGIKGFVDGFVLPLVSVLESVAADPDATEKLRQQLSQIRKHPRAGRKA